MSWLFRTALSFAIAFAIVAPSRFAAALDTPRLNRVRTDIAAQHPVEKLWSQLQAR